jgi:hypothetical protein
MALPKAIYDKEVPTRNLVSTILGILALVATILVSAGVLAPDQANELQALLGDIVSSIAVIWSAVGSIILLFKKDTGLLE